MVCIDGMAKRYLPPRILLHICNWLTVYLGITWAPGAWIYCGEVFPLKYRAKGVGLAAAGNWAYVTTIQYLLLT